MLCNNILGVPDTHINEYWRDLDLGYTPEMKPFNFEIYKRRRERANQIVLETERPGQPTVGRLVRHGDIIELRDRNIAPMRYVVVEKINEIVFGVECWGFKMITPGSKTTKGRYAYAYTGDYVAQDGEILHLFERNDSRVVVIKHSQSVAPVQLRLFR